MGNCLSQGCHTITGILHNPFLHHQTIHIFILMDLSHPFLIPILRNRYQRAWSWRYSQRVYCTFILSFIPPRQSQSIQTSEIQEPTKNIELTPIKENKTEPSASPHRAPLLSKRQIDKKRFIEKVSSWSHYSMKNRSITHVRITQMILKVLPNSVACPKRRKCSQSSIASLKRVFILFMKTILF